MKLPLRNELGFTIFELLVVIVVGSTVVSLGVSLYLMSQKAFSQWIESADQKRDRVLIISTIERDILKADQVIIREDTLNITIGHSQIVYSVDTSQILRNGVPVVARSEARWDFKITPVEKLGTSRYTILIRELTGGVIRESYTILAPRSSARRQFESSVRTAQ